ncbi:O-antigen ligase family protein [Sphingomonas gei]|uniref:O-antigen ligase family protein n=1 Tax=Sphingomonas gei TaxID=1395960 RepID=A0A4S1XCX6_9SPHN|nr:O-antigen ligase family protein [Sphingomonas gei]TGX53507.1 O-antigen ligase family protein [Sphingomonas gei]
MNQAASIARPRIAQRSMDLLYWFDAVWTAAAMGSVLFAYALGSKAALVILALMPVYFAVRFRETPRLLAAIAPILLLPGFAMASAIWSLEPGTSLYYGFQYFVTVMVGATIGAGTDRRQALYGLFAAFAVLAVTSLIFGREVGWGGGGASRVTTAFAGMTGSKNAAADTAAGGVIVACAMLAFALRERRLLWIGAAAVIVAIDLWILRRAESTGALVACLVAVLALIGWNLARLVSPQARTALFMSLGGTVVLAAALQKLWLMPLVSALLKATGKDPTLTGRTYIWDKAFSLIEARPVLGLGYSAFWRHGNIDAEGLWLFAGIQGRAGFNFHNTFIEILVHLGFLGLGLFALVACGYFVLLVIRTMRAPNDLGILFCAYLSYVAVRLSIETQAFGPFTFSTTMVMAGLGCAAWGRSQARKPATVAPARAAPRWRSV